MLGSNNEQMLAELEWIMKTAAEQATAQHAASGLTVDPSELKRLRQAARLSRPSASEAREGLLAAAWEGGGSGEAASPGAGGGGRIQ